MSEIEKYNFELILEHLKVCEKRFLEIKKPNDFIESENGNTILDAIVTRLQAVGENLKRMNKNNPQILQKYPSVDWEKIIRFRDFISHHYEKLDYEIIYDICKVDVPKLIVTISSITK